MTTTTIRIALTATRAALTALAAANRLAAVIFGESMGASAFQHDARRPRRLPPALPVLW